MNLIPLAPRFRSPVFQFTVSAKTIAPFPRLVLEASTQPRLDGTTTLQAFPHRDLHARCSHLHEQPSRQFPDGLTPEHDGPCPGSSLPTLAMRKMMSWPGNSWINFAEMDIMVT